MENVTYGYFENKDSLIKRLRKIEGQIRGIENMVLEDRYCIDILTQISAVKKAITVVALNLLKDHLNHCVKGAFGSSDEQLAIKLDEVYQAIERL